MIAITYDIDTKILKECYRNSSYNNAYTDIESFLAKRGFRKATGGFLWGDETVTTVSATIAIRELSEKYDWFAKSVTDIALLWVNSIDDLSSAL